LIGLGSDQVAKSKRLSIGVEAYHLDEFRDKNFKKLSSRIRKFKRGAGRSLILFISPQNLKKGTHWFNVLVTQAQRGNITGFCIDEAHVKIEQHDSFHPEFKEGAIAINALESISKKHNPHLRIPYLVLSATFRIPQQISFNKLIDRTPDMVNWGPMDKRNICVYVKFADDPVNELLNDWGKHITKNPDTQSLVNSNSATACDDTILSQFEKKVAKMQKKEGQSQLLTTEEGKIKEFIPLTGECGIMMKSFLMAAFCGDYEVSGYDDELDIELPTIAAMPCTSAAQCGISSKRCNKCYRYRPCPNWEDFVQDMGRVDRSHTA